MQVVDASGNVFGAGLEVTGSDGKPKVPVINTDITIGTTVITGGVSGRVLYDNAGVVGELDLSAIYVPTSRTITINGTTQDLSANRSWTISTGITIGTTAITSGTVGRVLFEGTGNVVQESANLSWNQTTNILNVGGDIYFGWANRTLSVSAPSGSGNGGSLNLIGGNATTSGTGGAINIYGGIGAGGGGRGAINIGQVGYSTVNLGGYVYVNNSGPNTGTAFQVGAGGQNGLSIYWDNLTPFMQYGLVSGRQARFVNSTSYTFSSKVFIGTNVDAGFKLDVNGTARVSDNFTVQKNQNLLTSIDLTNTTSGANSYTQFSAISDVNSGANSFGKYSTLKTAYKIIQPRDSYYYNGSIAGDFAILNDCSIGQIKFAAGGSSTAHMTIKSNGRINMSALPTSSSGLASGDIWNDAGTLKIV